MKHFLFFILFLLSALFGFSQTANSWISFSPSQPLSLQKYYKFKVVKEGIYRIDKSVLLNAGIPIKTTSNPFAEVDYKNLQLFSNGTEQALYIDTTIAANGVFMNYIQFYAKGNDGSFDASMYTNEKFQKDPSKQPNPYYSLFNDTATYYLTWNPSMDNKRYKVETDLNFTGYTPSPYFTREVLSQFTNTYYTGDLQDADYTQTEGYLGTGITLNNSQTFNLNCPNIYTSGPATTAAISFIGASNYALFNPDHHIRVTFPGNTIDTIFDGYLLINLKRTINSNILTNNPSFKFSSLDDWSDDQNPGRIAPAYILLRYPHTYSFDKESNTEQVMYIGDNTTKLKSYINITGFNVPSGSSPLLLDLSNNKIISISGTGGTLNALIPNSGGEKKCYLTTTDQINSINSLTPVSSNPSTFARFINYGVSSSDYDYIIISHKSLMTEAVNYKNYRNQTKKVLLVDIDELYDQFAYGIVKHPLSIRNFATFILQKWNKAPDHLFLLGKALHYYQIRSNPSNYQKCLVPSYGYPSSDNLLTAGINTYLYSPSIPTGRLAAQNNNDVKNYLEKVKAYESQPPSEWMKNVLHLGGGGNTFEQNLFQGYLNTFKNTIEGQYFGGRVTSFFKKSSAVIQINQSDYLKALVDSGVSLMTFFGHSSGSGFDQNIDQASAYHNKNRYPLIIANSCFAGDIHNTSISISEDFTLIPNKGGIGFIASISEGYAPDLFNYTNRFYQNLATKSYGQPVGKIIQKAIEDTQYPGYLFIKSTCLEMTYHGDPAIILNSPSLPDLSVNNSKIFFSPQNLTTQLDSFTVNVIINNIGKCIPDSFNVELLRKLPDGSSYTYIKRFALKGSQDTLRFKIPMYAFNAVGINTIQVSVDANNEVNPEITELNNVTSKQFIVQSEEIIPVYPYEFAIIPNDTVTLKASTSNPFALAKDYIFQLDTTKDFNSPFLKKGIVMNAKGGVVRWRPSLNFKDSVVYFWRVSPDSVAGGNYKWRYSSFTYIKDKTGWSQAHFHQFDDDVYADINYNRPKRKFEFVPSLGSLRVTDVPKVPYVYLNNGLVEYGYCHTPAIHVVVIDSITFTPWGTRTVDRLNPSIVLNPDNNFGNINDNGNGCRPTPRVENFFTFKIDDPTQRENLRNMLSKIPKGNYVLIYSVGQFDFRTFEDATLQAFENLGSVSIRTLKYNPYIFFTKKGYTSTVKEVVGDSASVINTDATLVTNWSYGTISSRTIGPASDWSVLHWQQYALEKPSQDSVHVNLYGIKPNGTDTLIISKLAKNIKDTSLAFIDAKKYPYLKLNFFTQDETLRTPAYLKKWQIYYTPKPEAALNPSVFYQFYNNNLQEGDSLKLKVVLENISPYDMDSMLYYFGVYDNQRKLHPLPTIRKRPLPAAGKPLFRDTVEVKFSTRNLPGLNSLWIEANPNNDQLEQYHFNNIGEIYFNVDKDVINPLMDVTFDGVHILDGDIVSAKPYILVQVKDENKFLKLDDPSLVRVFVKSPDQNEEVLIPFDGKELRFTPAKNTSSNQCKVEYNPTLKKDGKYMLRVQSKDKSNNASGYIDYKISFEVINKATITEVMNYPNPFSTSTQFVFTLTGSEIPTGMKIQIMTVTGKVVKEIFMNQLGPIHIGRNITQYAWDGRDQFGEPLGNGLYLYRVITDLNGSSIEKSESGADKYFQNGYGKMYLMR